MTVRIGFLGAGFIARHHLAMLRLADADAAVVVVWDPDPDRAGSFAHDAGAVVGTGPADVVARADAVYVCTPTATHPELAALVVDAGRALFCEKPLAVDLASATALADRVVGSGVVNQVGLVLRDSPALRWLVSTDDDDDRPLAVVFRDDQYLPVQGQYGSEWRGDVAQAGSGTLLEHSIHDVDLLEWVLGPVATVSATTRHHHGIDGIEDVAVLSLAFASGATGTLTSIWHDHLGRESSRRIELFRQRSVAVVEGDVFGPVRWSTSPSEHGGAGEEVTLRDDALVTWLTERGIRLRNPDGAFVAAVAAGDAAHPDVSVALRAHVVVDAAYRSAAAGGAPVAVPAPPESR